MKITLFSYFFVFPLVLATGWMESCNQGLPGTSILSFEVHSRSATIENTYLSHVDVLILLSVIRRVKRKI